jgi:hypothetical protein
MSDAFVKNIARHFVDAGTADYAALNHTIAIITEHRRVIVATGTGAFPTSTYLTKQQASSDGAPQLR